MRGVGARVKWAFGPGPRRAAARRGVAHTALQRARQGHFVSLKLCGGLAWGRQVLNRSGTALVGARAGGAVARLPGCLPADSAQ